MRPAGMVMNVKADPGPPDPNGMISAPLMQPPRYALVLAFEDPLGSLLALYGDLLGVVAAGLAALTVVGLDWPVEVVVAGRRRRAVSIGVAGNAADVVVDAERSDYQC